MADELTLIDYLDRKEILLWQLSNRIKKDFY